MRIPTPYFILMAEGADKDLDLEDSLVEHVPMNCLGYADIDLNANTLPKSLVEALLNLCPASLLLTIPECSMPHTGAAKELMEVVQRTGSVVMSPSILPHSLYRGTDIQVVKLHKHKSFYFLYNRAELGLINTNAENEVKSECV